VIPTTNAFAFAIGNGAIDLDEHRAGKFVYASADIAAEAARRDRFQDSLLAEKAGFNLTRYNSCCEKEAA
jgi:hypothetical protein